MVISPIIGYFDPKAGQFILDTDASTCNNDIGYVIPSSGKQ